MPDEEDFNPHQMIEDIMGKVSGHNADEIIEESSSEVTAAETPPAESAAPPVPTVEQLQAELASARADLDKKEKQRRDLESYKDKQMHDLRTELKNEIASIKQSFKPQPSGNPEEEWQQTVSNPNALTDLIRQEAARVAAEMISKDERVQKGQIMTDLAEFRAEHGDSSNYDPIIGKALDKFRWVPRNKEGLQAAYEFAKELIEDAVARAKTIEEAAKANTQNPQRPPTNQPSPPQRPNQPTAAQQTEIATAAARLQNDRGVSASDAARVTINPEGNLDDEIRKMVDATLNKQ